MVKKLLIVGDSFSASAEPASWTTNFDNYIVDNVSICGSSEYKLIKKLNSVNTADYDNIIFVHTSPNRIYVESNPYYCTSPTHQNCDLLYQDMHSRLPDQFATNICWWFENVFDIEHAWFTHSLLIDYAVKQVPGALHITFFDYQHPKVNNLHRIWETHPGSINHLSTQGNTEVVEFLKQYL